MLRLMCLLSVCGSSLLCVFLRAPAAADELPSLVKEDFENGMQRWETTDGQTPFWEVVTVERDGQTTKALRCTGKSDYQPPVRSPHSIALLKDVTVGDFEFTVTAQSTNEGAGAHRDLCLFWGYQDPSHFYYVHFGAQADPHACQIFVVDGKPRTMITVDQASGTPWTSGWHTLRVTRNVADGSIKVYFDDLQTPVMAANDKRFSWGRVGLGTFDDHGNFDNVLLRGVPAGP
jgi:hypothetical protein